MDVLCGARVPAHHAPCLPQPSLNLRGIHRALSRPEGSGGSQPGSQRQLRLYFSRLLLSPLLQLWIPLPDCPPHLPKMGQKKVFQLF